MAVQSAPALESDTDEPATEADYPPPWRAWFSVAVLTFLLCLSLLDRQLMSLLVPDIRRDLGLSDFQMGLLQGLLFSLFYATFGILFGWIIDRYSRRWVIFAGVTFWSIATAACGMSHSFLQLMLARFGVGAGEAALNPAGFSIVGDSFPKRRLALAFSVFGAGGYIGSAVSLLFGGYLIAAFPKEGVDVPILGHLSVWRAVFLSAGLPGLLIAFLIWTIAEPARRERIGGKVGSIADTFRFMGGNWRFYAGHFVGFALLSMTGYGYLVWSPVFLMRKFGIPITEVVNILAPIGLVGGICATVGAGAIVDRLYGRGVKDAHLRFFILVGGLLLPLFLVLAFTSSSLPTFMVFMMLVQLSAGFGGVGPAALTLVTPNNFRGQVSATYLLITGLLGSGVGPAIVGAYTTFLFHDDSKVGWAIALNGAIAAPLAALLFALTLKPMRRAVDLSQSWSRGT